MHAPLRATLWEQGGTVDVVIQMRAALLAGPAFFALWFLGAQTHYFASGGGPNGVPSPSAEAYPTAVLSNHTAASAGATMLTLAAISLLFFGVGLRTRFGSKGGLGLFPALAIASVAMLLIIESGLWAASLRLAEIAPDLAWPLLKVAGSIGFESPLTALLGGAALSVLVITGRSVVARWMWWFTAVLAVLLVVFGLLEGLGVTPSGRVSILFGLWAFVAGFGLAGPAPAASQA